MWLLDDGLNRPTSSLFPSGNNTISIGIAPLYNITFDLSHDLIEAERFTVGCSS